MTQDETRAAALRAKAFYEPLAPARDAVDPRCVAPEVRARRAHRLPPRLLGRGERALREAAGDRAGDALAQAQARLSVEGARSPERAAPSPHVGRAVASDALEDVRSSSGRAQEI